MMFLEYFSDGGDKRPLVLVHGRDCAAASELARAVGGLAVGEIDCVTIQELPGFTSVADCKLVLRACEVDMGVVLTSRPMVFECRLSRGTWDNVLGLLEPFAEESAKGFQYLSGEGEIEWLISPGRFW